VTRLRLRFLLQELDLTGTEVILGRSPDCQITIDDPLVSRRHARIVIENGEARVSDLGSRNGVRVNGSLIRGEAVLKHNDRVRLGTQDLVFLVVEEGATGHLARSTGYMMHCASCARPFPGEVSVCPHCGAPAEGTAPNGYDTITGIVVEPQTSWTFQLLGEVIDRALSTRRAADAERMFQRAAQEINDRVRGGTRLEAKLLTTVAMYALRLSKLLGETRWAVWMIDVYEQNKALPSAEVLEELESLDGALKQSLRDRLTQMLATWNAQPRGTTSDDEAAREARLARVIAGTSA